MGAAQAAACVGRDAGATEDGKAWEAAHHRLATQHPWMSCMPGPGELLAVALQEAEQNRTVWVFGQSYKSR